MNNDMKCPICGTILDKAFINDKIRGCPKCRNMGNTELWQELIRTRKALEVAVNALKELKPLKAKGGGYWAVKSTDAIKLINTALKQITAELKDN